MEMRLSGYVACMGEKINAQVVVETCEEEGT